MKRFQSAMPLIGFFVVSTAVLVALLLKFSSFIPMKGDMVAHFLVVDEIMKHGEVRPASFLNLNVMSLYPAGSHWLAALVGWVEGSGLYGIAFVSIVAAFVVYLMIFRLVDASAPINVVVFVVIFAALGLTHSQIGWEVSSKNFFYPQLVGDVLLFATLIWLARHEGIWQQVCAIVVSGVVTMFVQPLVALHVLGAGSMLIAYQGIAQWKESSRFPSKSAFALASVFAATILMALFHPSFRAMLHIAEHNGELEFGYSHPLAVGIVCGIVGVLNLWRHVRGRAQFVDAVLGSAGIASVCLMGMQFIALEITGAGSDYAVKKHMFIVVTLAVINGTRLISAEFPKKIWSAAWIASPVLAGLITLLLVHKFNTPIKPIDSTLRYANQVVAHDLPGFTPGDAVDVDSSQSPLVNLMVTLTAFQHPFRWIGPADPILGAKYVMVRRTKEVDENCSGRLGESTEYVMVRPDCLTLYSPGETLAFREGAQGSLFLGAGWSIPEGSGTWSDGQAGSQVNLTLPKEDEGPFELTVSAQAFVTKQHPEQTFDVEVNGAPVATWKIDFPLTNEQLTAAIPRQQGNTLKIVFRPLNPAAPASLDPKTNDTRILGLHLTTLALTAGKGS